MAWSVLANSDKQRISEKDFYPLDYIYALFTTGHDHFMIIYASLVKPMYRGSWFSLFIFHPHRSHGNVALPLERTKYPFPLFFPPQCICSWPFGKMMPVSNNCPPLLRVWAFAALALASLMWFAASITGSFFFLAPSYFSRCSWNLSRGNASVLCILWVWWVESWRPNRGLTIIGWWMDGLKLWLYWVSVLR